MMSEMRYLLKGRWDYNIQDNTLICKNKQGLIHIFENKDAMFFNNLISSLSSKSKANPDLKVSYETPEVPIPLELFHRILRSNEVVFEQTVGIRESHEGLYCFSNVTKNFQLNHYDYDEEREVYIDPQRMCKITRRIRDRERVHAKLRLEPSRIILRCEFPWTILTIIMPTIRVDTI